MNHKTTPDERFLMKLYEVASAKGDPCAEIDFRPVAKAIGQKDTAMKNIIKALAQANLVKKMSETTLCLTQRGCDFVLSNQ